MSDIERGARAMAQEDQDFLNEDPILGREETWVEDMLQGYVSSLRVALNAMRPEPTDDIDGIINRWIDLALAENKP